MFLFISYTCALIPSCFRIWTKAQIPLILLYETKFNQNWYYRSYHKSNTYPDPMIAIDGIFCVPPFLFMNAIDFLNKIHFTTKFSKEEFNLQLYSGPFPMKLHYLRFKSGQKRGKFDLLWSL